MAMSVGSSSEDDMMVEMNTTPLIDVMLVLLIMFIITIPVQTHAVKMNMPVNAPSTPPKPPEIVRIDIDAQLAIDRREHLLQPDRAILGTLTQVVGRANHLTGS